MGIIHAAVVCAVEAKRQLLKRNLQQELLTTDELMSKLRSQGVDDVSKVRKAYMESDGTISVLK